MHRYFRDKREVSEIGSRHGNLQDQLLLYMTLRGSFGQEAIGLNIGFLCKFDLRKTGNNSPSAGIELLYIHIEIKMPNMEVNDFAYLNYC